MADAKLTALTGVSVPAVADLLYLVDVSDTTDDAAGSSRAVTLERLLGLLTSQTGGRLTTESGVGVSTADRTSQGTIYYTPYLHDRVALYDGTRWKLYAFTERSLALSSLTSGKNYDVFLYDNSGTLTLELSAAWTDDTTRADALTTQDGVLVKSGATTRRLRCTIRTTGTTTTEDSLTKRFIGNLYNRQPRPLTKTTTGSHSYASTTIRQSNGDAARQVEWVCPVAHAVAADLVHSAESSPSNAGIIGIGLDSTTAFATGLVGGGLNVAQTIYRVMTSHLRTHAAAGYHKATWLEACSAGVTLGFFTNYWSVSGPSGLFGEVVL